MTPASAPATPKICGRCNLPVRAGKEHDLPEDCCAAQRRTMTLLMDKIGVPRACRACGATIHMVTTTAGVKPYDPAGTSHFLTCPNADQFYKKRS